MLAVRLDRPDGREQADLHRPMVVKGVNEARLDHRRAPGRERPVGRRHRHRGEILQHQHHPRRELEPDRQVPMPLVRRAGGAQPIGEFRVDEAGDRAEREVAADVEARLRPPPQYCPPGRTLSNHGRRGRTRSLRPRTPIRRSTRVSPSGPDPNSRGHYTCLASGPRAHNVRAPSGQKR